MMKHKIVLMIFLLSPALSGEYSIFAQSPELRTSDLEDVVITMKQEDQCGGCLYCCPVYSVSISGDGTVTYQGIDAVEVTGEQVHSIPIAHVKELVAEFYRIDFFSLSGEYVTRDNGDGTHTRVDHVAPVTISITINGGTKKVYNFFGAPEKLFELQKKIYEVGRVAQYVKRA